MDLRDLPEQPEIISAETGFAGAVWDVRVERFRYGGGELTRHYLDHPGAVAVVAIDEDDRVLLIQQYRHPIRSRDWEIPAGLLDVAGEAPLETARRELAEEADLVAETWEPLTAFNPSPGGSDEVIYLFLATGLSAAPDVHAREAEEADMRLEWVPLSDAIQAVAEGRFQNGTLGLGLFLAAQRRRHG